MKADDAEKQVCYFNVKTNSQLSNTFISKRIWQIDLIHFQIDRALSRSRKSSETTFSSPSELKDLLEKNDASNIGPKIGKYLGKSDISNFEPTKFGGSFIRK